MAGLVVLSVFKVDVIVPRRHMREGTDRYIALEVSAIEQADISIS